jgi:hypothetical protein
LDSDGRARLEEQSRCQLLWGIEVIFVSQPQVKDRLTKFFGDVLGCGAPVAMTVPALTEPILAFRFPGGGSISFEFSADALDEQQMRRGAWLELRTDDVDALVNRVLDAGRERVRYVATSTFYFVAPGGQVFGIVANQKG